MSYGVVDIPKSGQDREVPLTKVLHEALSAVVAGQPREARVALSMRGTPWGQNSLRSMFCRAAERAGIDGATFHHLRHGFVTALLNRGVGAHIVKELAGHSDLTTTEHYAHALRTNKRQERRGHHVAAPADRELAPPGLQGSSLRRPHGWIRARRAPCGVETLGDVTVTFWLYWGPRRSCDGVPTSRDRDKKNKGEIGCPTRPCWKIHLFAQAPR